MANILLVDDDPLQGQIRKAVLERRFEAVERVPDAADAFIRIEDARAAAALGLVIVALSRPGLGCSAFVAELTARLPWVAVLVLGGAAEESRLFAGANRHFLPRTASARDLLATCQGLLTHQLARPA